MPYIDFGESITPQTNKFIRLKDAGEQLQFRIIGKPFAEGNHFFLNNGKWDVIPCPRINEGEYCQYCDKLFKSIKSIPKIEDKKEYREAVESVKEGLKGYDVAISFNFPVINRETGEFAVFQSTVGIRNKIEEQFALGVRVMDVDFLVKNTGKKGKERYIFTKVDSSETKELTAEEVDIKNNFNPQDFANMITGKPDNDGAIAQEENSEVVDVDDVPF